MTWYGVTQFILTGVGFTFALIFVVDYNRLSIRSRRKLGTRVWWSSELGWLLMLGPASLGAIFAFVFASRAFGDSLARRIIGIVLYGALVITLPWWHRMMRRAMRKASTEDRVRK